ncbi:protein of unknown function [Clostridium collagenovorans DSM 3089]|uniref:Uncharacterized protein n=1 Tax=Clostridium collagenovorans DSM 3089 TaxID=1121306 RepID=A0A1M5V7F4_9CLOT|nr:DUF5028 domain-containing protein [Clostridium collagenovorans]SHH71014.1 protein of unknown function [Clostridium collagenovorans DSM 3089]
MKKKVFIIVIILLSALCIFRIYKVNSGLKKEIVQVYPKGEAVQVGKNFFKSSIEDMDGYEVTVIDSEIIPTNKFLESHGEDPSVIDSDFDYIYSIRILVKNKYNQFMGEKGIDFREYVLQGTDYMLTMDSIAYKLANIKMDGQTKMSLNIDDVGMEFTLTYDISTELYTSLEKIEQDPPKLVICQYPEKKMLMTK